MQSPEEQATASSGTGRDLASRSVRSLVYYFQWPRLTISQVGSQSAKSAPGLEASARKARGFPLQAATSSGPGSQTSARHPWLCCQTARARPGETSLSLITVRGNEMKFFSLGKVHEISLDSTRSESATRNTQPRIR